MVVVKMAVGVAVRMWLRFVGHCGPCRLDFRRAECAAPNRVFFQI